MIVFDSVYTKTKGVVMKNEANRNGLNLNEEQCCKVKEAFSNLATTESCPPLPNDKQKGVSIKKLISSGSADIIYCLSVGLLIYGIAGIIKPILAQSEFVVEKLACVGIVNLYGVALVGAIFLIVIMRKAVEDAVFLTVLTSIFFCAGGIILGVTATNYPVATIVAAAICATAGIAELTLLVKRVHINLADSLFSVAVVLVLWNYLAAPLMGIFINLLDGGELSVPVLMRQCWLSAELALLATGALICLAAFKRTQHSKLSSIECRPEFLFSTLMGGIFTFLLLSGAAYHLHVLTYVFNVPHYFSDFTPFAIFASLAILGFSSKYDDDSKKSHFNGIALFRLVVALVPLSLIVLSVATGGSPKNIGWDLELIVSPTLQLAGAGIVMATTFALRKWSCVEETAGAYLIAIILIFGAIPGEVSGFNLHFAGLALVALLLYLAISRRHPTPAILCAIAVSIGVWQLRIGSNLATNWDISLSAIPWILYGSLIYIVTMIFNKKMYPAAAFFGNIILATSAMLLKTNELSLTGAFIISGILLPMGIMALFKLKNFPLSFPLMAPFPLVCLYSAKNMTNWHLVAMSFILLAIGVAVSIHRKNRENLIVSFIKNIGLNGVRWNPMINTSEKVKPSTAFIIIFMVIFLFVITIPQLSHHGSRGHRKISCVNNLKQIGLSIRLYSNVLDDQYPPFDGVKGLEILRKEGFLENARIYTCPSTVTEAQEEGKPLTEETVSYHYVGGLSENSPVNTILAYDKPNNHDKYGNVLFVDGHVKGYAGANWLEHARNAANE